MPKALNSRPCPCNNFMEHSKSMLEGLNLSHQLLMKSKPFKSHFNNLSKPSPLDLTIFNETTTAATKAKEVEEVTKAMLATMAETIAMTIVEKARTIKIDSKNTLMIQISPVSLHKQGHTMEECITLKNRELENDSHLAINNQHNQQNTTYGDYQPNFNNREFFCTNVTRFSVNNTQISSRSDPSNWMMIQLPTLSSPYFSKIGSTITTPLKKRYN